MDWENWSQFALMRQLDKQRVALRRVSDSKNSQRLFVLAELTAARQAPSKGGGKPAHSKMAQRFIRGASEFLCRGCGPLRLDCGAGVRVLVSTFFFSQY
jgi:hypothetical protein